MFLYRTNNAGNSESKTPLRVEIEMKMKNKNKILIGGQALRKLGSDRHTTDIDYLINDKSTKEAFIVSEKVDLLNANGNKLFAEIYKGKGGNEIASPQSLLDLKAYDVVQQCQNMNWQKVDSTEYDMRFLVRKFGLKTVKIANKHMTSGELSEVMKVIKNVKI